MEVKVHKLTCKRCGHTWTPRIRNVRSCPNPKCHSYKWDISREEERKEKR